MVVTAPLQLLIFRHPDDRDVEPYEDAIVRAFQGGKEAGGYLATAEDLGIRGRAGRAFRVFAKLTSWDTCAQRPIPSRRR